MLTDEECRTVEANVGLIGFTIRRYFPNLTPDERDEAWQDGTLGLIRAVQGWDEGRGRLATYAVPWIRAMIQKGAGWREGINHRRAMAGGLPLPDRPWSLDETGDDGETEHPALQIEALDADVEGTALARVRHERAVAGLVAAVRDAADATIVAVMVGELAGHRRSQDDIAREHGIAQNGVMRRRRRLERAARVAS